MLRSASRGSKKKRDTDRTLWRERLEHFFIPFFKILSIFSLTSIALGCATHFNLLTLIEFDFVSPQHFFSASLWPPAVYSLVSLFFLLVLCAYANFRGHKSIESVWSTLEGNSISLRYAGGQALLLLGLFLALTLQNHNHYVLFGWIIATAGWIIAQWDQNDLTRLGINVAMTYTSNHQNRSMPKRTTETSKKLEEHLERYQHDPSRDAEAEEGAERYIRAAAERQRGSR